MDYVRSTIVNMPYAEAVNAVKEALKEQGFGVLTEIDVKATLREKLGADMEDYIILGACNPQLAYQALDVEREIGALLPCNVVVRRHGDRSSVIDVLDPQVMVTLPGRTEVQPVADEASRRLGAAMTSLTGEKVRADGSD
jgi:uncharacterized protein (DUF302 family)